MEAPSVETLELVCRLVGPKEAIRLYQGSLTKLFNSIDGRRKSSHKLLAARELIRRLLAEELAGRPALCSPGAVRDFLRLLLSSKEHEDFVVLFLDAQNRLISAEELFRGPLTHSSV